MSDTTTTMYRPVALTSVEQAESLPEGSIAMSPDRHSFARKTAKGWKPCYSASSSWSVETILRGWTALVPVSTTDQWSARQPHPGGGTRGRTHFGAHESRARQHCDVVTGDVVERRLVTDWEPA